MNSVVVKKGEEKIIYTTDNNVSYEVEENGKLTIFHYSYNVSSNVVVNLNGENALVEYHYSTINYSDNKFNIVINHNKSNTISNVYNHGVNVKNNILEIDVSSIVPKSSFSCICNQENQIINLENGNSKIDPKLLIENYDVTSAHAAYIGKFKSDLIFYFMSRGISKKNAIKLLIKALLINGGNDKDSHVIEFLEKIKEV